LINDGAIITRQPASPRLGNSLADLQGLVQIQRLISEDNAVPSLPQLPAAQQREFVVHIYLRSLPI